MSRRAAIVEEFDDDTDIPLPSHPLPNTGSRGPLIEELHISDDEFMPSASQRAGPASPPRQPRPSYAPPSPAATAAATAADGSNRVTDITPYKTWTCIYPIYLDAKRPYGTGQRRVERAKSLWWPLSKDIADAAMRLGLRALHEITKTHPRDWENPGRVRVQWKKDGKLVNPAVKTKKQLLEMICFQIQLLKPENIPKPPFNTAPADVTQSKPTPPTSTKGKQPAATKSKSPAINTPSKQSGRRRLPVPPEPHPPLANRVSAYSPALSSGVLIETVKAGMNATENSAAGGAPGPGAPGGGMAKGKRKVVRVRG